MEDLARRRMRAQELLDDPVLMNAFDKLEEEALKELLKTENSWFRNVDLKRAALIHKIAAIKALRQELHTVILSGKIADYPRVVGA